MKNEKLKFLDIVLVDFGLNQIGSEQGGKRPAVVIQNNIGNKYSPTTIVLPITSKLKNINQPTHVLLKKDIDNGLSVDSIVLAEAVRQISKERIIKYLGKISNIQAKNKIKMAYIANLERECS